MTKLAVLNSKERGKFNASPKFSLDDRQIYFLLSNEHLQIVQQLRRPTNKVGFVLQLGYFKSHGKFYTPEQFKQGDVNYVIEMLGLNRDEDEIDLSTYQKKIPSDHRKRILDLLGWQPFNKLQQRKIIEHVEWLVQRQVSLRNIFLSAVDFCWQHKIEIPTYNTLCLIIINSYNNFEQGLINTIANKLTPEYIEKLNTLVSASDEKNKIKMHRPKITLIKRINQSLSPTDIKGTVTTYEIFKKYFHEFKGIIDELQISDQATAYFAEWVKKATTTQLNSFANKNKLYLHLVCYIKHQFYYRHDVLIDIFLKSVTTMINTAKIQMNQLENKTRTTRNKAIKKIATANKGSRATLEKITELVKTPSLLAADKLSLIEALIDQYNTANYLVEKQSIIQAEHLLEVISKNKTFFDALELVSLKLQNRVSEITKVLECNASTSTGKLIVAINHFRLSGGKLGNTPPLGFLAKNESEIIYVEKKLRISLYKVLLFVHMADAIKSGHLNLLYSYRYKAIQEYLIDEQVWKEQREKLISNADLTNFSDFTTTIEHLKKLLDCKYEIVNQNYLTGKNSHLKFDKNGKIIIDTPPIDSDDTKYISTLLNQAGLIPVVQVLNDVNSVVDFTSSFKHSSVKHTKMKVKPTTIFAGIIGKGCNIGVENIANISVGINENILKNTVNWCFSVKNIQNANNQIASLIGKLALANNYRHNTNQIHTGSDGRKVNVAVDSILASYSFKYFGKNKGVSIYTFLDERQLLYHFTVISSSEREAAYVIDGLLQNEVVKSDIHSTDTHGFTETVFAATHFIYTAFAPRIANIGEQNIYAFKAKNTYAKRGYKILPSRTINLKIIATHWDDILRFMATIKLKYSSASQLFKRLSSYAKENPLYQAIKEFGRIIKSIFILTYFDEVELRQRIEKQLNKVEQSNKFSNAVFFHKGGEFKYGLKEEQEIATGCKILIQNAIVLWNYLYLSQLIANNDNLGNRKFMINALKRGSMITWKHVNFQGEYDFIRYAANDLCFDMGKILELKVV